MKSLTDLSAVDLAALERLEGEFATAPVELRLAIAISDPASARRLAEHLVQLVERRGHAIPAPLDPPPPRGGTR